MERVTNLPDKIVFWGLIIFAACASITMSGQVAGIIIALFGWLIGIIFFYKKFMWNRSKFEYYEIFLLGFLASLVLSSILSVNAGKSMNRLRLLLGDIAVYFVVVSYMWDKKSIQKIIKVLVIFAVIESFYGIIQYFTGIKILNFSGEHIGEIRAYFRVFGTWDYYNSLGGILGMIIPISLFSGIYSEKRGDKWLYLTATLFITVCLLLTRTRGACLGVIAALIVSGFVTRRIYFIFFVVIFITGLFIYPATRNRITKVFRSYPDLNRLEIWRRSIKAIKDKPLLGSGLATFSGEIPKQKDDRHFEGEMLYYNHAHSIYLGLAAESGLVSLILFLMFAFSVIFVFFRRIHFISDIFLKGVSLGFLGTVIDFLIHGMVDYNIAGNTTYLFWFACAFISSRSIGVKT